MTAEYHLTNDLHPRSVLAIARDAGTSHTIAWHLVLQLLTRCGWDAVVDDLPTQPSAGYRGVEHTVLTEHAAATLTALLAGTGELPHDLASALAGTPLAHTLYSTVGEIRTPDGTLVATGPMTEDVALATVAATRTSDPVLGRYVAYAHTGRNRVFLMVVDEHAATDDDRYRTVLQLDTAFGLNPGMFPTSSAGHRLIERGWMPVRRPGTWDGWTDHNGYLSMPVYPITES